MSNDDAARAQAPRTVGAGDFDLTGKVAVITGGSSGLGVAFALRFARFGADIALGARRADRLAETREAVEALGRRVSTFTMDVTDPEACTAFVGAAVAELGRVDILINNAGLTGAAAGTREAPESFRSIVDTNLMGSYWMAQACARQMPAGSSIINIGSVLGLTTVGLPQAAYSASKAGIIGLTRDLAQQWSGRKGIRVNALAPGYFPTDMTEVLKGGFLDELAERRIPMGRLGELEECAAAAHFLASDAASYITGILLPVDGGMLTT
jgi:NAD(P)-dependent dehydrogenase (short-subunit alcohol dehydrogenase family)